jgi:nucleoside 2-deoxyribosyltransferase
MSVKCYIAGPWTDRKGVVSDMRDALIAAGFTVTASWIDSIDTDDPAGLIVAAKQDIEDIYKSDVFILINQQPRGQETSGKAVETGIAMTLGLPILGLGEKTNIFHHLEHPAFCTWYKTIPELVNTLQDWVVEADRLAEEEKLAGAWVSPTNGKH